MAKTVGIKTVISCLVVLVCITGVMGCAGIEPPQPEKILKHPLGAGPIDIGMSKEEITSLWGEPDLIRNIGESTDRGRTQKEEWIYQGRMTNLPVNYGYLSKSLHLYFDGNNLTSFKEE